MCMILILYAFNRVHGNAMTHELLRHQIRSNVLKVRIILTIDFSLSFFVFFILWKIENLIWYFPNQPVHFGLTGVHEAWITNVCQLFSFPIPYTIRLTDQWSNLKVASFPSVCTFWLTWGVYDGVEENLMTKMIGLQKYL